MFAALLARSHANKATTAITLVGITAAVSQQALEKKIHHRAKRSSFALCEGEKEGELSTPLELIQTKLNESDIPINLQNNNFLLNAMCGLGVIAYWGSMWNLLDKYFFARTVRNPSLNNLLRVAVGVGILMFPDNDIKELGDHWEGIEDEDEVEEEAITKENVKVAIESAVVATLLGFGSESSHLVLDRRDVVEIFARSEVSGDGKLTMAELKTFVRDICQTIEKNVESNKVKTTDEGGEDDDTVDRFAAIENYLNKYGFSLDLHDNFFQNIFIGTGIITIWSGLENLCNIVGGKLLMRNVLANNLIRICMAISLLYLPGGNFNAVGDGFLEDEEEDCEVLTPLELQNLVEAVLKSRDIRVGSFSSYDDYSVTLEEVLSIFDSCDTVKDGKLSVKEFLVAAAEARNILG